ncbi:MAG: ABC transporter ATP-binding protein [Paludibacteraceae bacterium]
MTAIEFENISKQYRLGLVSTRTLSHDLNRWWKMNILGKEDPYLKIGEVNDRASKGESEYVWALKDINFKVEQGDVLGIIGKNGAGKSTLLKILSKVTAPTTGSIKARGRIASLLEVGTGFHPEMTGRENIYMNGAIMGMTKAEITRKLDEIVDFSGVERYLDTPVKRYSSGMTVRLGFAIAAHLEPEILVVDEVLAVGDAEFQKKAIGKMQDVSKGEGRTVLFVSHNMASIRMLCNKGILLENGNVLYEGTANESVQYYLQKNSIIKGDKIIDGIKYNSDKLRIDFITTNGSEGKILNITDTTEIEFCVKGSAIERLSLGIELRIYDENEVPLIIYSPGHYNGTSKKVQGEFELTQKLILPKGIIAGKYFVDIFFTNPLVVGYADILKGVILETDGHVTKTGFTFNNSQGHGSCFYIKKECS